MNIQDEDRIQQLITRYQKRVFALVLYLIGGDKNAAYDITVAAFAKALQSVSSLNDENFFIRLAGEAVAQSRKARVMPVADSSDFVQLPPEKKKSLEITKTALLAMPFEERAALLLRDQMRLSYKVMALILKISEKSVRVAANLTRIRLRKKLEEFLKSAG